MTFFWPAFIHVVLKQIFIHAESDFPKLAEFTRLEFQIFYKCISHHSSVNFLTDKPQISEIYRTSKLPSSLHALHQYTRY